MLNDCEQADVFLQARDKIDSLRNSRVSVFLRLLEYHTGGKPKHNAYTPVAPVSYISTFPHYLSVLILTSNRVRSFDRAFVS